MKKFSRCSSPQCQDHRKPAKAIRLSPNLISTRRSPTNQPNVPRSQLGSGSEAPRKVPPHRPPLNQTLPSPNTEGKGAQRQDATHSMMMKTSALISRRLVDRLVWVRTNKITRKKNLKSMTWCSCSAKVQNWYLRELEQIDRTSNSTTCNWSAII